MKWGISLSIAAIHESELWGLPPPSKMEKWQKWNGTQMINVLYHFSYSPQSRKEWQRVAGIKVQIANKIKGVEFNEYEPLEVDGKVYTISELGKHFKAIVKFPAPFFDGTPQAILTRHAKRLYYEGLLHIEQIIFASMWIKEIAPKNETGRRKKDEGIRQVMRRASSAHQFALDHKDGWSVKLNAEERHKVLSQSALKSAQVRRDNNKEKRERTISLRDEGKTLLEVSSLIGVNEKTVRRWLK